MKIVIINGSPKGKTGATEIVTRKLVPCFEGDEIEEVYLKQGEDQEDILKKINQSDGFVLVSPLYWNGLPFAVMQLLAMGQYRILRHMPFACVLQSDMANAVQYQETFALFHQFAKKADLQLYRIVGIEQGGALYNLSKVKLGVPPTGNMKKEFHTLVECFHQKKEEKDVTVDFHIPSMVYTQMEKKRWKELSSIDEKTVKKL